MKIRCSIRQLILSLLSDLFSKLTFFNITNEFVIPQFVFSNLVEQISELFFRNKVLMEIRRKR